MRMRHHTIVSVALWMPPVSRGFDPYGIKGLVIAQDPLHLNSHHILNHNSNKTDNSNN